MSEEKITPNFEFGALIGRGVLLIILGVLFCILINSGVFGAITAAVIPPTIIAILLIFLGIAMICGGTSFGGAGAASVVLGILVIILGIVALLNPATFTVFLVYFLGAAAVVGGIFNLISGIMEPGHANRALTIVAGILGIILGVLIFVFAFHLTAIVTAVIIVYAAAIFMVLYGIISIIQAIMLKSALKKAEA